MNRDRLTKGYCLKFNVDDATLFLTALASVWRTTFRDQYAHAREAVS